MTPEQIAALVGAIVLCLGNLAALIKVWTDNAKIKTDRTSTKEVRDKDSQELHDKVLKLEFQATSLKDQNGILTERVDDANRQINLLNTQLAQVLTKLDNVIDVLKELKEHRNG
jgi:hypothetical protein